ncbi:hypothetical protein PENTCL1PPCAC_26003, partial [Pristionchus entomophagus]
SMPGVSVVRPDGRPETSVFTTRDEMQMELIKYMQTMIDEQMRMPGFISIGLSGGSMPKIMGPVFAQISIDPDRLRLFLVDERIVDITHPDSNYGQWMEVLPKEMTPCLAAADLMDVPYRPDINTFPYDVGRTALQYEQKVRNHHVGPEMYGKFPRFDMLFLGMGPDGHTASIFPNSKQFRLKMESSAVFVGVDDSPKPPSQRLTMTIPAINAAAHVAFICTGEDKATVLKSVIDRDLQYPASHVSPINGKLRFFLDAPAAAKL